MTFLPEEDLKAKVSLNLAPMIDFLFLMLVFFAFTAVSRAAVRDTRIDLVKIYPNTSDSTENQESSSPQLKIINLTLNDKGEYNWVTDMRDHKMLDANIVAQELQLQHQKGLLPKDKALTQVLVKIDRNATWEPILQLIFAVRDAGFEVYPVYLPSEDSPS